MFNELFDDDIYDLTHVNPRWMVQLADDGFRVVDTISDGGLKTVFDRQADANEICNLLNEYEAAGNHKAGIIGH